MMQNEYDEMIEWCRNKIKTTKQYRILTGKRLEGYEAAMLQVMSYLHCEKEKSNAE